MTFLKSKNISALKGFFGSLPWILGRQAFAVILALIFLSVAFGGILLYNFIIKVQNYEPESGITPLRFNKETYQEVLSQWNKNQERSMQFDTDFSDPFVSSSPEK